MMKIYWFKEFRNRPWGGLKLKRKVGANNSRIAEQKDFAAGEIHHFSHFPSDIFFLHLHFFFLCFSINYDNNISSIRRMPANFVVLLILFFHSVGALPRCLPAFNLTEICCCFYPSFCLALVNNANIGWKNSRNCFYPISKSKHSLWFFPHFQLAAIPAQFIFHSASHKIKHWKIINRICNIDGEWERT